MAKPMPPPDDSTFAAAAQGPGAELSPEQGACEGLGEQAAAPLPAAEPDAGPCSDQDQADEPTAHRPPVRLRPIDRSLGLPNVPLDELLPDDDPARLIWDLSGELDFSAWLDDSQAREGLPGRDATSPRLLFCLW